MGLSPIQARQREAQQLVRADGTVAHIAEGVNTDGSQDVYITNPAKAVSVTAVIALTPVAGATATVAAQPSSTGFYKLPMKPSGRRIILKYNGAGDNSDSLVVAYSYDGINIAFTDTIAVGAASGFATDAGVAVALTAIATEAPYWRITITHTSGSRKFWGWITGEGTELRASDE